MTDQLIKINASKITFQLTIYVVHKPFSHSVLILWKKTCLEPYFITNRIVKLKIEKWKHFVPPTQIPAEALWSRLPVLPTLVNKRFLLSVLVNPVWKWPEISVSTPRKHFNLPVIFDFLFQPEKTARARNRRTIVNDAPFVVVETPRRSVSIGSPRRAQAVCYRTGALAVHQPMRSGAATVENVHRRRRVTTSSA